MRTPHCLAIVALLAAACGSDSDSDGKDGNSATSDAGTGDASAAGSTHGGGGPGSSGSGTGAASTGSGGASSGGGGRPSANGGRAGGGSGQQGGRSSASGGKSGGGGGGGACDPLGGACNPDQPACCGDLVCVSSTSADYSGCREPCATAADCASDCCIPFANLPDKGFCGDAALCQCSGLDGPCGGTAQCCAGFTCTTFDATDVLGCRPVCAGDQDCDTDCCIAIPGTNDSACFMASWCGK